MKTDNTLASNQVTLSSVQLLQVIEQLDNHDTESLISIYNDYADMNKYERINDNDEHTINDLYSSPYGALLAASYGDYNPNHDYFTFDGYNNLSSFNYADDENSPIDIEELAQWIVDNELFNDYDIEVTTLDDMLASIEDNITDDEALSLSLIGYLDLPVESLEEIESYGYTSYNEYLAEQSIDFISDYDYNQLNDIITLLGISYK